MSPRTNVEITHIFVPNIRGLLSFPACPTRGSMEVTMTNDEYIAIRRAIAEQGRRLLLSDRHHHEQPPLPALLQDTPAPQTRVLYTASLSFDLLTSRYRTTPHHG